MNPFRPAPARASYRDIGIETAVASASPHQLVLLLFDGAIDAIADARIRMDMGDIPGKGKAIGRASRIIGEGLLAALDMERGGQIAANLRSLYEYMMKQLLDANLHNRAEILGEVMSLLNELRGAWAQIGQRNAPVPVTSMPAPRQERRAVSYGAA
jgi:flagellar secretion chaperone FliS